MHRVFNCGIGMIIVVSPADAARAPAMRARAGGKVWRIGTVTRRPKGAPQTLVT